MIVIETRSTINVADPPKEPEKQLEQAQTDRIAELLTQTLAPNKLPSRLPPIKNDKHYLNRSLTPDITLPKEQKY